MSTIPEAPLVLAELSARATDPASAYHPTSWADAIVRIADALDGAPMWAWLIAACAVCVIAVAFFFFWYLIRRPVVINRAHGDEAQVVAVLKDSFLRVIEEMSTTNSDLRNTVDKLADVVAQTNEKIELQNQKIERQIQLFTELHNIFLREMRSFETARVAAPPSPAPYVYPNVGPAVAAVSQPQRAAAVATA